MTEKNPPDYFLTSVVLILLGLGLVAVYSSSSIYALEKFGNSAYFLERQFLWILIGTGAGLFFANYEHRKLRRWVHPLLLLSFLLLVLVLIFGREVSGARRWLRLGGVGFQPSELTKLILILFVAYYCDKKRSKIGLFQKGLLPLLAVVGLSCGLIFLQPDLGTPVLIFLVCLTMAYIGGARASHLALLGSTLAALAGLAVWLEPYRRRRLFSFLNPWANPQGDSYQLIQSFLAMGSGGLSGAGIGASHSKLLYLPEPHTDFIFPIFAEEFGLFGSWIVLLLFALLAWSGWRIASRAANLFSTLLASGITLMIVYQSIFNIAVVTGCLPTKGIPLPFLSFGGSSMVVALSAVGVLLNISRSSRSS